MRVSAHLLHVKLKNLACIPTVARDPHYTCGVQVQYICTDNEMHWFCSWAASSSISQLTKYMGMSLLINT